MEWFILIGLFCLLAVIGFFITGRPFKFAIGGIVFLVALAFVFLVVVIIWTMSAPCSAPFTDHNSAYCQNKTVSITGEISNIPLNSNTEVPTCSISFTPTTITLGEIVTSSLKTTGFVTKITSHQTGFFPFNSDSQDPDPQYPEASSALKETLNSGETYSTKIKPSVSGEASETDTVTGSGGSSSCTASVTIIPKSN
jgi:cytoskeletal protein RodZ